MMDILFVGFLLFRGAGPGSESGFPYHVLPLAGGPVVSHRLPDPGELVFLRADAQGRGVIGMRHFGQPRQTLVEAGLQGTQTHELGHVQGFALYYPALSPDRTRVVALIAPGRTDLPPSGFREAHLVVFPNRGAGHPAAAPGALSGFQVLATGLPVVPPDWSADGQQVFFVTRDPGEEHVAVVNLRDGSKQIVAPGVLPKASPDGRSLAFVQGRKVVVVSAGNFQPRHAVQTEWSIGWLAWSPNGGGLAVSETGPVYRSRLSILDAQKGSLHRLFEGGPMKDLCWVSQKPNWPAHPN